jgi:hypothetical protein
MWPLLTVDAESKDEEGNTLLDLDPDHFGCLMKKKKDGVNWILKNNSVLFSPPAQSSKR